MDIDRSNPQDRQNELATTMDRFNDLHSGTVLQTELRRLGSTERRSAREH